MMGELNYFLGLQVKQPNEGIFINQSKYVKDLLKKFGFDECSSMKTPVATSVKMDANLNGKRDIITNYRGMIGSLLYLTVSRPDIMLLKGFLGTLRVLWTMVCCLMSIVLEQRSCLDMWTLIMHKIWI